ncbi:MAG: FAD-dependent monooxygenase [Sphingomonadaceae bacterium]|nr:FAD-dependent monooxygenase [Sphingomonadaceae bacterium]
MSAPAPLIVGGGPAGAMAALLLAREGCTPRLIERAREPHDPVCGGFLSADAIHALARVGLDIATLRARPIRTLRVVAGTRRVETELPFAAAGLSRRRLDVALLERAKTAGAEITQGVTVRRVDAAARSIVLADGAELTADAIFLATGKHDLRGAARPSDAAGDDIVGLRTALAPSPAIGRALAGAIELHLFAGGYAGLLLQEDGSANLCLSIAATRLRAASGSPDALLAALAAEAPLLGARLDAAGTIGSWSSIARVPYGWRASTSAAGLFRIGDQAAVIASLAGDGIAGALSGASAAVDAYRRGGAAAAPRYQDAFARRTRAPLRIAELLRGAGEMPRIATPAVAALRLWPRALRLPAALTRI